MSDSNNNKNYGNASTLGNKIAAHVESHPLASRLLTVFHSDVVDVIASDRAGNNRLLLEGQLRIQIRNTIAKLTALADMQLEGYDWVKLIVSFAAQLHEAGEHMLAMECYDSALNRCDNMNNVFIIPSAANSTLGTTKLLGQGTSGTVAGAIPAAEAANIRAACLQGYALMSAQTLLSHPQSTLAPQSVSQRLKCIQTLRASLSVLFELPPKDQELLAWQVLNSCKLLYSLAQPLIWLDCGKYVIESLVFAHVCMESIISLCSARHVNFRLKLLSSAFLATLSSPGGKIEEATKILELASKTVSELREREELDKPIPMKNEAPLVCAECDVALMRCVLSFWSNPDSFELSDAALAKFKFPDWSSLEKCEKFVNRKRGSQDYFNEGSMGEGGGGGDLENPLGGEGRSNWIVRSIQDRCICECIRVQQLSGGNMNEVWKKRGTAILKGFWAFFEKRNDEYFVAISSSSSTSSSSASDSADVNAAEAPETGTLSMSADSDGLTSSPSSVTYKFSSTPPLISISCLAEVVTVATFDNTDFPDTAALLEKIWSIVKTFPPASLPRQHMYAVRPGPPSLGVLAVTSATPFTSESLLPNGSEELVILHLMKQLIESKPDPSLPIATRQAAATTTISLQRSTIPIASELVTVLHTLLSSNRALSKKYFVRKVVFSVWGKYIYPLLQQILTSETSQVDWVTAGISECLTVCVRGLESVAEDDPVLYASMALLAGKVLWVVGDFRGNISLLKHSLDMVDELRAARIDLSLLLPTDPRDIYAIQKQSFSCSLDASDWYHSLGRLGAHAYAGYGVAGAGSEAQRVDSALAEIHSDMLCLYFRHEIEYEIRQQAGRKKFALEGGFARGATVATAKAAGSKTTQAGKTAGATKTRGKTGGRVVDDMFGENVTVTLPPEKSTDSLAIVSSLKSYCGKNCYLKCLLFLEMAKVESQEDNKKKCLKDAYDMIREAEAQESALLENFRDMSVVGDASGGNVVGGGVGGAGKDSAKCKRPLVLARSHKFFYIAPTDIKTPTYFGSPTHSPTHSPTRGGMMTTTGGGLKKAVKYYRIFAKEEGSGELL